MMVLNMAEVRVIIPQELKKKMDKFQVDWPTVLRKLLKKEVDELSELEAIVSKSKLTEKDALELGRKVNKSLVMRFKHSSKAD